MNIICEILRKLEKNELLKKYIKVKIQSEGKKQFQALKNQNTNENVNTRR